MICSMSTKYSHINFKMGCIEIIKLSTVWEIKICLTITFIARCTALKIHNTIAFRQANFYNINEAASHCKYFYESTKQRPSSLVVFFVQWNNHSWNDLQFQSTIISKLWIKIPLLFTRITYAMLHIGTLLTSTQRSPY